MLRLNKHDRRVRQGHPWVFSNEINTALTPLKGILPGTEVVISAHDSSLIGKAYVNPHSLIAARIFSRDPKEMLDLNFFTNKLNLALERRTRLYSEPYYRLIFSEADGLPGLVIDRFNQHFVVQINTAGMELKKELLVEALRQVFPDLESILGRNDSPIRQQEGLALYVEPLFGTPPATISVIENGVRFEAPLLNGQKTGWFYDHRDNRARLKKYVQNRKVLDVFSYLGAFGIQAATFGAASVDFIDSSSTVSEFIEKNARLNNVQDKVTIIIEDAFLALKTLLQEKKRYDVIILDPPAFVKKNKDRKEGLIAYLRLNELALKLLSENGILVSCSCSMQVSMEDLTEIIGRAAQKVSRPIQLIERGHQGMDHPIHLSIPETDYLKAIFVG